MAGSANSEDEYLQECQNFVLVVIAEIAVFTGKWNIIRKKLQLLAAQIADFPGLVHNSLCKELLKSIISTLNETREVVSKCVDIEVGIGKLQMQSSLDGLGMKFTQHLRDCELLMRTGLVTESATPPGLSRSRTILQRETIRSTGRELLARLQMGNLESRKNALDSLLDPTQEEDINVFTVTGQGIVPVLAHLLDSSSSYTSSEIREKAAVAVCRIAKVESFQNLLVMEGVLPPLVRILDSQSGSSLAKEKASEALQALTCTPENAHWVGTHGGVCALVDVCGFGTLTAQAAAAATLRNLAFANVPEMMQDFVDENAIPVLIRLASSGTTLAQEHAVDCLQNLASADDNMRTLIAKEGGIRPLIFYWDRASTARTQEIAMGALTNMSYCRENAHLLIDCGFIPRLVNALSSGTPIVKQLAAGAIYELATSMENRKALGDAGSIPGLLKMVDSKTSEIQEAAVQALSLLLLFDGNRKLLRKEERGILGIVQLLDPCNQNTDKQHAISILLSLSSNAKCKRQMVAGGACIYLQKLAEMDVRGAKKLVECLGRGHLWSMFGRI